MLIALDIDEVLSDTLDMVNDFYNRKHGTSFKLEDFKTYEWKDVWGCELKDSIDEWYAFMSEHGENIKVSAGAIEGVKKLSEKHELVAVTSRAEDFEEVTKKWLEKNFSGAIKEVYFVNHYNKNGGKQLKKSFFLKKIGADFFVEDHLDYAADCASVGIPVLLLDKPWNQGDLSEKIERVFSWNEIVEKVTRLDL